MCPDDTTDCYKGSLILTPNTDGSNDVFVFSCLENPDNTLYIYDRYGRTVYTQSNYDNTWGGLDSSGNELPENGYMWVLEVISSEGIREVYKGTTTILRNSY
jgi:gliding motility-associated-like protein